MSRCRSGHCVRPTNNLLTYHLQIRSVRGIRWPLGPNTAAHRAYPEDLKYEICAISNCISKTVLQQNIMTQPDTKSLETRLRALAPLTTQSQHVPGETESKGNIATSAKLRDLQSEKPITVQYLAYGSNLSAETFLGKRGIRPLSYQNVCVPKLKLTFDLPGIAYTEPCFANSGWRNEELDIALYTTSNASPPSDIDSAPPVSNKRKSRYHKDRWHKPLVGVLYELTLADYIHVIATEGGGASYKDVIVDCHPLDAGATTVPMEPTNTPIKGHTLFAPAIPVPQPPNPPPYVEKAVDSFTDHEKDLYPTRDRYTRPDPAYAQPSARYLKLITDGAKEHNLPHEYQEYIDQIRPYTITSQKLRVGQFIFASIWLPIIMLVFAVSRKFADKNGQLPPWLAAILGSVFMNLWRSYDQWFRPLFGDGERTRYHNADDDLDEPLDHEDMESGFDLTGPGRKVAELTALV